MNKYQERYENMTERQLEARLKTLYENEQENKNEILYLEEILDDIETIRRDLYD